MIDWNQKWKQWFEEFNGEFPPKSYQRKLISDIGLNKATWECECSFLEEKVKFAQGKINP